MNSIKYIIIPWLLLTGSNSAQAITLSAKEFNAEHQRGVMLARAEKYEEGLTVLRTLLQQDPEHYAVIRDIVIITTWTENCPKALQQYKRIQAHANQESYLLGPVSQCLYETGNKKQAFDKLESAIAQWPDDSELKEIRSELKRREKEASAPKSNIRLSVGTNESDQGNQEWFLETRYNRKLQENIEIYARFITVRADDPRFETGDLNRVGVGAELNLHKQWALIQDFSFDIDRSGEGGSTTTIVHSPNSLWSFNLGYASFAEDLPLRAKAQSIDANRVSTSADFHTKDYLWTWSASAARYNFSDSNNRQSMSTAVSYAYVLRNDWEQRIIFDIYKSANSNDDSAVYYNPKNDLSIGLTHQLDIVYDTRFKRHVDHIYVSLGNYKQKNFSGKGTWGIRFEQEYDFDDTHSFGFSIAFNQRVYDGNREDQKSFLVNYSRKL